MRWTTHESPRVRRAVSESTRARLPWAERVPWLIAEPTLKLLERLKDDDEFVRRSVANNLNDLSKDHPALVLEVAHRWLSPERRRLVKHALRALVKKGEPQALALARRAHGEARGDWGAEPEASAGRWRSHLRGAGAQPLEGLNPRRRRGRGALRPPLGSRVGEALSSRPG
jgi:hypothetical protein